jgi:HAD superfamily hydrolase (TIGR01509 family)
MTEVGTGGTQGSSTSDVPWPAAVLLDMDGTLVDTEPYWIEAEHDLIAQNGGTWSHEHAMNLVGCDLLDSGRYIREHAGIDLEPSEIVEQLLDRVVVQLADEIPWRDGAQDLLAMLVDEGLPTALVTMSWHRFVVPILQALPDDTFTTVVTGDAVSQGKPHPEPYLRAASLLRVDARECLAIEDSNTGVRSAVAAGCTVLVVPNHVPVLEGESRIFRDSLVGLGLDDLRRLRLANR